jgi:hypothetical protein
MKIGRARAARRIGFGSLFSVLAVMTACREAPPVSMPPARIQFAETDHSFGQAAQGAVIEHRFAFANAGGMPLRIERIRPDCGCSGAAEPANEIGPGGSGAIHVRCELSNEHGAIRAAAAVHTNDPEHRSVLLTLQGSAQLVAAVEPPSLYTGTVQPGGAVEKPIDLLLGDGVEAESITAEGSRIRLVTSDLAGRRGKQLRVAIADDAPEGPFEDSVRIQTSSPARRDFRVPVAGVVRTATAGPGVR